MDDLKGGMMPPEAEAAPADDQQQAPEADGGEAATPQEQQAYDALMDNCLKLAFDKRSVGAVLKSLGAGTNFVMNLANVTAHLIVRAEASAKQAGMEMPGDVVLHVGQELLSNLAELSKAAGIHTFNDKELERAGLLAIDNYRELGTKAGIVDPEALKQQFAAANQQGGGQPQAAPDDEAAEPAPDDEQEEEEA